MLLYKYFLSDWIDEIVDCNKPFNAFALLSNLVSPEKFNKIDGKIVTNHLASALLSKLGENDNYWNE